jgi:hypothetical protein
MTGQDDDTVEPQDVPATGLGEHTPQIKRRRRSFGNVRRELNEDELDTSGVQKMLLDELDRLESAELDLKSTSEKYHEANTKLAVATEKLKTHNAFDIMSTGTVAVGSLLFGAAFNWQNDTTLFWILSVLGIFLVIVGVIAKVIRA